MTTEISVGTRLICPFCKSRNSTVVDSRAYRGEIRRRRYLCKDCDKRYSTAEIVLPEGMKGGFWTAEDIDTTLVSVALPRISNITLLNELRARLEGRK